MKNLLIASLLFVVFVSSCNRNKPSFDASGTFEAEETIISSEASGAILQLKLQEGQHLQAGDYLGFVDTVSLYLKKKQLLAQSKAVLGKKPNVAVQLAALEVQLKATEREKQRIANMVKVDAATPKQLDDATSQVDVIKRQIEATQSTLGIASEGVSLETDPIRIQIQQLNEQLRKCHIINPISGTVLTKYARQNEVTSVGKPLYKIADLSSLLLRAYISGNQLSQIQLGQKVKVLLDNGPKAYREVEGTIIWITDKAEFTPKTIQTKEERANLVYAIKVKVINDGKLKIGMYGEVKLQ